MAVFFLVVGLEIGRERRHGDLADGRTAVVPVAGALGGMLGAGLVYALVNHGGPGAPGWGIPMATDIAFALGALALLGRRVPAGLRVFLLTLAVADDIGSVVVLAVFYSSRTSAPALIGAAVLAVGLVVLRRTVRLTTAVVLAAGVVLWVLLAAGGVEPALAGVVAGLLVPARRDASGREPAERLERRVAPWSAFAVLPVFAVANAGITFHSQMLAASGSTAVFAGVALARVAGKIGGITVACLVVVRAGLGRLPGPVRWRHLVGGRPWPASASPSPCSSPSWPSSTVPTWCRPPSSDCSPGRPWPSPSVPPSWSGPDRAPAGPGVPRRRGGRRAADPVVTVAWCRGVVHWSIAEPGRFDEADRCRDRMLHPGPPDRSGPPCTPSGGVRSSRSVT